MQVRMMERVQRVKEFFDITDRYLESNPIIELRKIILQELLGECNDMTIIDIGCGNGELTKEFLSKNKVTFLDISENMLSLVKRNISESQIKNAIFVNSDISYFTPEHKYDIAVCFGVIAHVEDVLFLIRKLVEITSSGGTIILQFTDSNKLLSRVNQFKYKILNRNICDYKINVTSTSEIYTLLTGEGLTIVKKAKYLPVSPLLSAFNYKTKLKLLLSSYRSRIFSFLRSEVVLCLSKTTL